MSIPHDSASLYCHSTLRRGGEGGIRTHETVARLRHFQCRALGQLCDLSRKLSAISLITHEAPTARTETVAPMQSRLLIADH